MAITEPTLTTAALTIDADVCGRRRAHTLETMRLIEESEVREAGIRARERDALLRGETWRGERRD